MGSPTLPCTSVSWFWHNPLRDQDAAAYFPNWCFSDSGLNFSSHFGFRYDYSNSLSILFSIVRSSKHNPSLRLHGFFHQIGSVMFIRFIWYCVIMFVFCRLNHSYYNSRIYHLEEWNMGDGIRQLPYTYITLVPLQSCQLISFTLGSSSTTHCLRRSCAFYWKAIFLRHPLAHSPQIPQLRHPVFEYQVFILWRLVCR